MTDLVSPSPEELTNRRRALRKQRRIRNVQNIWRVLAIVGLAGGSIWLIQKPFWLTLSRPDQVVIEGNQMLADAAIREVLDLEYPEPLLQIEPEVIAQRLQTQSPIAFVQVERHLFPPRLEITLQERQPVAVTIPSRPGANTADTIDKTPVNYPGLVDIEGYWMPQDPTLGLSRKFEVPTLRIQGFNLRYQEQWTELYEAIQSSAIQIDEVDLRSPSNLILKTELGTVHLGIYDPLRFQEQLSTLPRFRSFTTNPDAPAIDFIDLSNPQMPAVKLSQAPNPAAGSP